MSEKGDGGERGRTLWDVLAQAVSNKRIWRSLLMLVTAVVVLSYFDVVNIRYDDGLKIRIGADPERRKKNEDDEKRRKDDEEKLYRFTKSYQNISGVWSGVFSEEKSHNGSRPYQCSSSTSVTFEIVLTNYKAKENFGQVSAKIYGKKSTEFTYTGTRPDREEERRRECYYDAEVFKGGVAIWDLIFDGSFKFVDADQASSILATFVRTNCGGNCLQMTVRLNLNPSNILIFRGPDLMHGNSQELVIPLYKSVR